MSRCLCLALALWLAACNVSDAPPPEGDTDGLLPGGRACVQGEECESGWCVQFAAGTACAYECAGKCPLGLACKRGDGRDPYSKSICVPATSNLCNLCDTDADCGLYGDLCAIEDGGEHFCTLDCSETLACPEGYACESFRDKNGQELSRQCLPTLGTCSCDAANDGARRSCTKVVPGVGTCEGMETCVAGVGWVSCDARTPVPEICDQQDNDCDGLFDEDLAGAPLQRTCGYGPTPRRQECVGVETCVAGIYSSCSVLPPPANEQACDGLDDDCDGQVDEDLLHGPDHCDGCDDTCPPGPSLDYSTERICINGASYYCGQIKCRVPYFDMNQSESDGCELTDDHEQVGEDTILNDAWHRAFDIPGITGSCNDPDGRPSCLGCDDGEFIASCGLKIPSDDLQHVPSMPPSPNIDFHWFYMDDALTCLVDTWVCAYFPSSRPQDQDAQLEVCVSDPVDDLSTPPAFSNCQTETLSTADLLEIGLSNSGNEYFHVRVRSLGPHYAGTYALAAFDEAGNCPLSGPSDPCTY